MQLQQLRYLLAIVKSGLNISGAAESIYRTQPGISKQLRLLEEELGVPLFERSGRQLTGITPAGQAIIELAEGALANIDAIHRAAMDYANPQRGELSIATTHTQARYVLPPLIRAFVRKYPEVGLHLHQGSPAQIADLAASGAVDFAIATESLHEFDELVMMPCYCWNRSVVVPQGHPLCTVEPLTLEAVAAWPVLTYVFGFTGRSKINAAFRDRGLEPRVVFTATDADVIKTYIRLGLGVGILASMAYDEATDDDLQFLDAAHLFQPSTTKIGFRRGMYLRAFHYDFLRLFASHLTHERVDQAITAESTEARERLFEEIVIRDY